MHIPGSPHKIMKTWRNDQSRKLLDKETTDLWRTARQKCLGWGSKREEVTGKTRVSLMRFVYMDFLAPYSISGIGMSSILLVQGRHLSHRRFMPCFWEEGRGGGGQSEPPASAFSQALSVEDIQCAKVPPSGVVCPEPYQKQIKNNTLERLYPLHHYSNRYLSKRKQKAMKWLEEPTRMNFI